MASSGSTFGTVVRWDEERRAGLIEAPGLPGPCWVDESVVVRRGGTGLRAGQTVELEWTDEPEADPRLRATRVVLRDDLQTGLGG
jgi:cold shock CspA family protein